MIDTAVFQKMYQFYEQLRARRPELLEASPERAAELANQALDEVLSYSVMDGRNVMPGEFLPEHEALRRVVLDRQGVY